MGKLRIPAVLAVATIGCGGKRAMTDADPGSCRVFCVSDFTDAGVCPSDPFVCVSSDGTCPAGCRCDAYCVALKPEHEINCPRDGGLTCATADGTCPLGCEATALG